MSIDNREEDLSRGPWEEVSNVLVHVLATKLDKKMLPEAPALAYGAVADRLVLPSAAPIMPSAAPATQPSSIAECEAAMSTKDHIERLGRWRRDTILLFGNPNF